MDQLITNFFDDDIYKLLFKLANNLVFLTIIIKLIFERFSKTSQLPFTYFMLGNIVFFLCFSLKKIDLDLGMALGLFAIFGILRYRTTELQIKEMTYLFVVIGISVMNALTSKRISYIETLTINFVTIITLFVLELNWQNKIPEVIEFKKNKILEMDLVYDSLHNIESEKHKILIDELNQKFNISIESILIKKIDLKNNSANVSIKYFKNELPV